MIVSAERHVFLQSPYFILNASMAGALKSAALAGIDVKVMLSARPSGDKVPAWAGNTYLERDFERDLAHCTEFDPAEYQNRNTAERFKDSVARLFSPLL